MKNYSKGKIYCLVNDDMIGLIYYGSTIQTLKKRLTKHRSDNKAGKTCTSKYLFEVGEPEIILLENYPCKSEKELVRREGYYHRNFECICGGRYITQHKASHFKTKKHKEYLSK